MQGNGIVKSGFNALGGKILPQRITLPNPDNIQMMDGVGPTRNKRRRHMGQTSEKVIVLPCNLSSFLIPFGKFRKLKAEYRGLKGVQSSVIAFDFMDIFGGLPVVTKHADLVCNSFVVGGDCPSFAQGPQIFAGIKAKSPCLSHRPGLEPAVLFA